MDVEARNLRMKLDRSVSDQMRSGIFYGIMCFFSQLSNWSSTLINYALPAAIFFHIFLNRGEATSSAAEAILIQTVYAGILQTQFQNINYHGQAISQFWSIANRAVHTLSKSFEYTR